MVAIRLLAVHACPDGRQIRFGTNMLRILAISFVVA
jgi:hypothetical protein